MVDTKKFMSELERSVESEFKGIKRELDFNGFLEFSHEHPTMALRTVYQYVHDSILSFGMEEIMHCGEVIPQYDLFDDSFSEGMNQIFGTERPIRDLVNEVRSSARGEGDERIIILRGPPGTAKTTMVDLIAEGLRHYSRTDAGMLFNFSWKFDVAKFLDQKKEASIGFVPVEKGHSCSGNCDCSGDCSSGGCGDCNGGCGGCGDSSGDKKIIEVNCQINENPFYLIVDKNQRRKLLESISNGGRENPIEIPQKLLHGELCFNCRQIYEALLDKYEGNLSKVFSHVIVERMLLDYDRGLVNVVGLSPTDNYNKVRTYANELAALFPKMDFISMFGKWASSNRGIIHFSDIFKSGESTVPLLDAAEKHRVVMAGVTVGIDSLLIATTNTEEFTDVREGKYARGLMNRIKMVDVGYILNVNDEEKIYRRNLVQVSKRKHIAPHTLNIAAMWAVLTRLSKPMLRDPSKLTKEQKEFFASLSPMEKLEIYEGKANYEMDYVKDNHKHLIDDQFRLELVNATNKFVLNGFSNLAEGNYGISPRNVQDIFKLILEKGPCLNPLNLIRRVEEIMREDAESLEHLKDERKMVAIAEKHSIGSSTYHDSQWYLQRVKIHYRNIITDEVKFAIIDFDREELDKIVIDYVRNVEIALQRQTGSSKEEVDKEVLEFVEELCDVTDEDRRDFRHQMILDVAEYDDMNPDAAGKRNYRKACSFLYDEMEVALFNKRKKDLDLTKILRGLEVYGMKPYDTLDRDVKYQIESLLFKMHDLYGYCDHCARSISQYVLKEGLLEGDDDNLPVLVN